MCCRSALRRRESPTTGGSTRGRWAGCCRPSCWAWRWDRCCSATWPISRGRRPIILGCLVAMAAGMYGAAQAANVEVLLLSRLVTGLGIGGMLAAINAATAEVSNNRWRSLAMALLVIGYPLGGVLGGIVVKHLLASRNLARRVHGRRCGDGSLHSDRVVARAGIRRVPRAVPGGRLSWTCSGRDWRPRRS